MLDTLKQRCITKLPQSDMVLYRLSLKYDVNHHALLTMVAFMHYFGANDNSDEVGIFVSTGQEK